MNTQVTTTVVSGGPTGRQIEVTLGEHESAVFAADSSDSSYSPELRNTTRIRVHFNTGLGNSITVRGNSYPLRWDVGRGMRNISDDIWEFEFERISAGESFKFKPLLNDTTWSVGDDYTGIGGQTIDIYPQF